MSGRTLFRVESIDVFYGSSQILFGVSIELAEGQTSEDVIHRLLQHVSEPEPAKYVGKRKI